MAKKKKEDKLMKRAKETMALGTISTVGTYGFSRVGSVHPATAPVAGAAVSGLQLLNVGQLAKNAMTLTDMMKPEKKRKKY